jgi:hypothetical protein
MGLKMSSIVRQLAKAAGVSPILRGAHGTYIRLNEANAFLSECAEMGVTVLGIETFDLLPQGIRPDMDLIADFSLMNELPDAERSKLSIAEAKAFVEKIPKGDRVLDFQLLP